MSNLKTVLVVTPHPDDLEIGMGMTVKHLTQSGVRVVELLLCRGELSGDPDVRQKEAEEAAKILGINEVIVHKFPNTLFDRTRIEVKDAIEEVVKKISPDVVYLPWKKDEHIDHVITAKEGIVASRSVGTVIHYMCLRSRDFQPNFATYGDESLMRAKIEAIKCYKTQSKNNVIDMEFAYNSGIYWQVKFTHYSAITNILGDKPMPKQLFAEPFIIEKMTTSLL